MPPGGRKSARAVLRRIPPGGKLARQPPASPDGAPDLGFGLGPVFGRRFSAGMRQQQRRSDRPTVRRRRSPSCRGRAVLRDPDGPPVPGSLDRVDDRTGSTAEETVAVASITFERGGVPTRTPRQRLQLGQCGEPDEPDRPELETMIPWMSGRTAGMMGARAMTTAATTTRITCSRGLQIRAMPSGPSAGRPGS